MDISCAARASIGTLSGRAFFSDTVRTRAELFGYSTKRGCTVRCGPAPSGQSDPDLPYGGLCDPILHRHGRTRELAGSPAVRPEPT
jgi:hypothetical protein